MDQQLNPTLARVVRWCCPARPVSPVRRAVARPVLAAIAAYVAATAAFRRP